jgi:hypothetical protein
LLLLLLFVAVDGNERRDHLAGLRGQVLVLVDARLAAAVAFVALLLLLLVVESRRLGLAAALQTLL